MTHEDFEEAQRLAGLVNITADNIHAAFRALKPGEEVTLARLFVKLVEAFGDVVDTLPSEPAPAAVCSTCDGAKEVYHGLCASPECDHWDTCPTCCPLMGPTDDERADDFEEVPPC